MRLCGFVRNETDGTVYIEVEGEQGNIDKLVVWLRKGGPPQGRVDGLEISEGKITNFSSFDIR